MSILPSGQDSSRFQFLLWKLNICIYTDIFTYICICTLSLHLMQSWEDIPILKRIRIVIHVMVPSPLTFQFNSTLQHESRRQLVTFTDYNVLHSAKQRVGRIPSWNVWQNSNHKNHRGDLLFTWDTSFICNDHCCSSCRATKPERLLTVLTFTGNLPSANLCSRITALRLMTHR